MSRPGRNDPCPCGNGRKYKMCCLDRNVARLPFTSPDRLNALSALFRFAQRAEFGEPHDDDELRAAMELEESTTASLEWFAWDFRMEDGRTICEALLARDRDRLRSGENAGSSGARDVRGRRARPDATRVRAVSARPR